MKIIPCPLNGPRNASEFICAGPVRTASDLVAGTDDAWTDHLFAEENAAGVVVEWWCHLPSSYWFILERDTRTDDILATFAPDERPDLLGRET